MTVTLLSFAVVTFVALASRLVIGRRPIAGEFATFTPVDDLAALDALFAESETRPVTLYLHDPYCPINRRAFRNLDRDEREIHIIDVSEQHELNREVERRTSVRHESPQAFVLFRGRTLWSASHGEIDGAEIDRLTADFSDTDRKSPSA